MESFPGITSPLTQSFVKFAYYSVFKGVAYRCLKNKKLVKKYDPVFRQMVGSANGRVYYKISNWYTIIKFLPFSKKIIPIWQEMMGVSNKEHEKGNNISFIHRIRVYFNAIYEAFNVQKGMEKLNMNFDEVEKLFLNIYHENIENKELIKLYDSLADVVLKDYEKQTNQYISGITNIESMKPIRELIALSKQAVDEGVIEKLASLDNELKVKEFILSEQSAFIKSFNNYIRLYGDRITEELKLETKTFRSNPKLLIDKILEYGKDVERLNNLHKTLNLKDIKVEVEFSNKIGKRKNKSIERLSRRVMQGIKNREISRLNRTRLYGMVRTIFLTIGSNMVKEGTLDNVYDIFYLNIDEVFNYIKGKSYDFPYRRI